MRLLCPHSCTLGQILDELLQQQRLGQLKDFVVTGLMQKLQFGRLVRRRLKDMVVNRSEYAVKLVYLVTVSVIMVLLPTFLRSELVHSLMTNFCRRECRFSWARSG